MVEGEIHTTLASRGAPEYVVERTTSADSGVGYPKNAPGTPSVSPAIEESPQEKACNQKKSVSESPEDTACTDTGKVATSTPSSTNSQRWRWQHSLAPVERVWFPSSSGMAQSPQMFSSYASAWQAPLWWSPWPADCSNHQQPWLTQHQNYAWQPHSRGSEAAARALQRFAADMDIHEAEKRHHPPAPSKCAAKPPVLAVHIGTPETTPKNKVADVVTSMPAVDISDEPAIEFRDEVGPIDYVGHVDHEGGLSQEKVDAADAVQTRKRHRGWIKTFSVVQGFGFIQAPDLRRIYDCDVFLNHAVEGGIHIGDLVSFDIEFGLQGLPQARNVVVESPAQRDPFVKSKDLQGRVKSFNSGRGYGFIVCPEVQSIFGGRDIYASKAEAPAGFSVGQDITFRLAIDSQGRPQARDIVCIPKKISPSIGAVVPTDTATQLRIFG